MEMFSLSLMGAVSIPDDVIEFFFNYLILPATGPEVDSASNRNEYQESCLGVQLGGT
jgi:hypothetical protein